MLSFADQGTYDSNVHLEEADRFAHRRLDMQRLDILPVFLEQRDQEVNAWHDECKQRDNVQAGTTRGVLSMTLPRTWSSDI